MNEMTKSKSRSRMSKEGLVAKVIWEGDITDTIRYGIESGEVPEEIEVIWRKAQLALDVYDVYANEIQEFLDRWEDELESR